MRKITSDLAEYFGVSRHPAASAWSACRRTSTRHFGSLLPTIRRSDSPAGGVRQKRWHVRCYVAAGRDDCLRKLGGRDQERIVDGEPRRSRSSALEYRPGCRHAPLGRERRAKSYLPVSTVVRTCGTSGKPVVTGAMPSVLPAVRETSLARTFLPMPHGLPTPQPMDHTRWCWRRERSPSSRPQANIRRFLPTGSGSRSSPRTIRRRSTSLRLSRPTRSPAALSALDSGPTGAVTANLGSLRSTGPRMARPSPTCEPRMALEYPGPAGGWRPGPPANELHVDVHLAARLVAGWEMPGDGAGNLRGDAVMLTDAR